MTTLSSSISILNIVIVTYVALIGEKYGGGLLSSSPNEKTKFQCPICTNFNTEKYYGVMLIKFGEKKCFCLKV
jgi:hypothetical protein